jgi:hypothetical protein
MIDINQQINSFYRIFRASSTSSHRVKDNRDKQIARSKNNGKPYDNLSHGSQKKS